MKPIYTLLFVALLIGQPASAGWKFWHKDKSDSDNSAKSEQKTNTNEKATTDSDKKAKPEEKEKAAAAAEEKKDTPGPTAFVQLAGSHFNTGAVVTYDFNLGYRFTKHLSADVGLPLYTTRTPYSLVTTSDWRYTTILGAPYLDLRYDTKRQGTNITSILTASFGVDMVSTYSTGRTKVDWFNHFDREYQIFASDAYFSPFLNFGLATGTVDRQVYPRPYAMVRPYETLGFIADGEAGGAFTIKKHYKLEGSVYGLAPGGGQKIFSRIVAPDNLLGGDSDHHRYWNQYFETSGSQFGTTGSAPSYVAKDNGYGAYMTVNKFKNFNLMFGYTRSIHYAYDTAFIMLRYDFTGILRNLTIGE